MDLTEVARARQSHVLAGFVYFVTPNPQKCLTESLGVLQPGGACAVSSWRGNQWMGIMLLVKKVRPEKAMPSVPAAWTTAEGVRAEFEKAGFRDAGAREVVAEMAVENAEALVELFWTKMPHVVAMKADMSEEEIGRLRKIMVEETERVSGVQGGKLTGVSVVGWGQE